MTRFYKRPILLIEFDPNKSFSLQVSKSVAKQSMYFLYLHVIIFNLFSQLVSEGGLTNCDKIYSDVLIYFFRLRICENRPKLAGYIIAERHLDRYCWCAYDGIV